MADRSVKVRLDANVEGFKAAMSTATKAVQDFDKRSQGYIQNHKASINDLSNTALGLGAGLIAGAGLAAKAAMDWESAWTGVQKTVEGTDAEMASLEQGLRDMAKSLPATHAEIAAVAEAAGQLGIATPNIESFTKTMIDMGESTNLSAEEAATSLARFMNVMGTAQGDVGRLGATVVGLGNNFATTESEIVGMGQRLSGAGAQAGLTEGEVLGLAAAMSSVGIEAEAGGSAMSLTMKRIGKAVDEGGESLDLFARVSGVTAQEFAAAWQSDPAAALDTFITGLSSVEEQGMTTNGVLSELGITGIRESDALLRLSAAAGMTADAMAQGNAEFEEGTALIEEASKRYQTAESKLAILRNTLVDVGIDVGGALAPALADAADTVGFLVEKFQGLPDAAKQALGMGAGLGGIALLSVGALGKATVAVSDLRVALKDLGIRADTTGRKLKLLGVGSAVGLAITGLAAAVGYFASESAKAQAMADSLAGTFDELTGAATASTDVMILEELNKSITAGDWDQLKAIGYSYSDVVEAIKEGGPAYDQLWNDIERTRQAANTWTDSGREQSKAMHNTADALRDMGPAYRLAAEQQAELAAGQEDLGVAGEEAAAKQEILTGAIEATGVGLEGVIEDMQTFLDLLFATGLATMSARDAQSAYHESVAGVDDAVQTISDSMGEMGRTLLENKTDFDLTTEAGSLANEAFQDIARSGMDLTGALADNGATQEELQGTLTGTYNDLVKAAEGMGIEEQAAKDLAREVLGIPDGVSIETWMSDEAERQAQATQRAVDNVDRSITVTTYFRSFGAPGVRTGGGASRPGGSTMTANADGNVWESPTRIKAFANGAENHVAQIAGAGSMRLWAEPETGGEAYIPLALSKRARSERILADVAGRFNMGLSKFENGGMVLPYEPRRAAQAVPVSASTRAPFAPNIYGPDAHAVAREAYSLYRHDERLETAEL